MPGDEPSDRLRLEYRIDDGVAIVDADGEIDVFTCGPLRDRLLALVDEGHSRLVVNLGRVASSIRQARSPGRSVAPAASLRWRAGPGSAIAQGPRRLRHHRPDQGDLDLREHG
jgi:hypothetical protein